MWNNKNSLYEDIVTKKGHFYVCGDVRMADDVVNTLVMIFESVGKINHESAESYLETMKVSFKHF